MRQPQGSAGLGGVKLVEVPLQDGILGNADLYAIGPRLQRASQVAWHSWATTGIERYGLGFTPAWVGGGVGIAAIDYTAGIGAYTKSGFLDAIVVARRTADGLASVYRRDGTEITGGATPALSATPGTSPAAFALIPERDEGYVVPKGATAFWKVTAFGAAGKANFAGTNIPTRADALLYYLGRLWMAENVASSSRARIWYTDANDATMTVRATSFLNIPDSVSVLARATVADLDAGAQGHLVIGGNQTIHVLDGDPTFGSQLLRQLTFDLGIKQQNHCVETPYGLVFFASDRQIYALPPGADRMPEEAIGEPIRDALQAHATMNPTLAWDPPYVFVALGNATTPTALQNLFYVLDLSSPTRPKWWGPHTTGATASKTLLGAVNVLGTVYLGRNDAGGYVSVNATTSNSANDITPALRTGYFHEPDHNVQLMRVILVTMGRTGARTYSITATTADGRTVVTRTMQPKVILTSETQLKTVKTVWTPHSPVSGDAFFLDVSATTSLANLDLVKLLVEYRVVARQD